MLLLNPYLIEDRHWKISGKAVACCRIIRESESLPVMIALFELSSEFIHWSYSVSTHISCFSSLQDGKRWNMLFWIRRLPPLVFHVSCPELRLCEKTFVAARLKIER